MLLVTSDSWRLLFIKAGNGGYGKCCQQLMTIFVAASICVDYVMSCFFTVLWFGWYMHEEANGGGVQWQATLPPVTWQVQYCSKLLPMFTCIT